MKHMPINIYTCECVCSFRVVSTSKRQILWIEKNGESIPWLILGVRKVLEILCLFKQLSRIKKKQYDSLWLKMKSHLRKSSPYPRKTCAYWSQESLVNYSRRRRPGTWCLFPETPYPATQATGYQGNVM